MYIAVDDTDSRDGMCTTFLATELVQEFNEYQLLDYPRLVRLNPNVPWKTRGNGAIVLTFGEGKKQGRGIGHIQKKIHIYEGDHTVSEKKFDIILERAEKVVKQWSELECDRTDPGLIVSKKKTPYYLYEKAVKDIIELDEVVDVLENENIHYTGFGKKRGLIGAASALAWETKDHTYELITYRKQSKWGTPRIIEKRQVKELDRSLDSAFDSYDYEEDASVIDPNSPCPVLYGVRGEKPEELKKSLEIIDSEEPSRWITFLTNQGTDDHIQSAKIENVRPWLSVKIKGKLTNEPYTIKGGHIFFEISDEKENSITAAAYEPTKGFREIVKRLIVGDVIELYGGVRKDPMTLNIEKMKILHLEDKIIKTGNPVCPSCNKRMSSIGKNAGFRCKRCSKKASEEDIETRKEERDLEETWYETPVSARRHLSKPLKRIELYA
ncbi:MAG: TiaS agmantine-binding domain-containing protein [Candidatus Saliniplasma sp.]